MPDLAELALLVAAACAAGVIVGLPLIQRGAGSARTEPDDDFAALALRHRIAVDALRDVEADRRTGSLDEVGYAALRHETEVHAAQTLAAVEAGRVQPRHRTEGGPAVSTIRRSRRRWAVLAGGAVAVAVLVGGTLLPAPWTLANQHLVDEQLAAQQSAEQARQVAIGQLQAKLATDPRDVETLVRLASLYLDGGREADRATAARLLILAIGLDAQRVDAYRLLITAYLSAADYTDATAATDAYARARPDEPDIAFFRGLIAYRGAADRAAAVRWFDRFLQLAPDDPRAEMVRSLRAEAAGQLPGSSPILSPTPGASPGGASPP